MPEYIFTIRAFLPDEPRALTHLSNLMGHHGFPAAGEVWEVEPDGTRKLISAHASMDFENHRRAERAIRAMREGYGGWMPDDVLHGIVRTVLDA